MVAIYIAISWDMMPWSPYVNRRCRRTYHHIFIVPSRLLQSGILLACFSALKMEVLLSSETPVFIRTLGAMISRRLLHAVVDKSVLIAPCVYYVQDTKFISENMVRAPVKLR